MSKRTRTQQGTAVARQQALTNGSTMTPADLLPGKWWVFLLVAVVLLALTFGIYQGSLHGPFTFDDRPKIIDNPDIKDWQHIWAKLVYPYDAKREMTRNDPSRPVVYLSFAFNYALGKLDTFGYRLFNVLLHCLNALLLFACTRLLMRLAFKREGWLFPAVAAALFAIHPICTSTVSYVFSRSDILALFFFLSSLLCFAHAVTGKHLRFLSYPAALVCFALSFYSKQSAATLPVLLLLFDLVLLSAYDWRQVGRRVGYHLPFWALLVGMLLFRYLYFGTIGDLEAKTPLAAGPYFMTQGYSIVRYIQMILAPVGLCFDHGISPAKSFAEPQIIGSWLLIAAALVGLLLLGRRKQTPAAQLVIFYAGWFIINLAPTSSFLPTTAVIVENRVYIAGLAWAGLLALCYYLPLCGKTCTKAAQVAFLCVALLHITLLTALATERNSLYADEVKLWKDVVEQYPKNGRAHMVLGNLYNERKDEDKAIEEFELVKELEPTRPDAQGNLASIYYKRGKTAAPNDRLEILNKTIPLYQGEVRNNPSSSMACSNLANALYAEYDLKTAMHLITPDDARALLNSAIDAYRKSIALHPQYADAYYELGTLYIAEQARYTDAIELFKAGLPLPPSPDKPNTDAKLRGNLGFAYLKLHNYADARTQLDAALRLDPQSADTYRYYTMLYHALNEPEKEQAARAKAEQYRQRPPA